MSALVPQASFRGKNSGGVSKCWLSISNILIIVNVKLHINQYSEAALL